jgi:hypothetical protein
MLHCVECSGRLTWTKDLARSTCLVLYCCWFARLLLALPFLSFGSSASSAMVSCCSPARLNHSIRKRGGLERVRMTYQRISPAAIGAAALSPLVFSCYGWLSLSLSLALSLSRWCLVLVLDPAQGEGRLLLVCCVASPRSGTYHTFKQERRTVLVLWYACLLQRTAWASSPRRNEGPQGSSIPRFME